MTTYREETRTRWELWDALQEAETRIAELEAELTATKGALNSTLRTKLFAKKEAP
jgi:hypothetical protein